MSVTHPVIPMTQSGFCMFPSATDPKSSHAHCEKSTCMCACHGGTSAPIIFRRDQIVRDSHGAEFVYVSTTGNGKHLVESVDTGERMFLSEVRS